MRHYLLSILIAFAAAACSSNAATQVMVEIDAEPSVRDMASQLHVEIRGGSAADPVETYLPVYENVFDAGELPIQWPRRIALAPSESARGFWLSATAEDIDGAPIVTTRTYGNYDTGRGVLLRIWLRETCVGTVCDDTMTCASGECVSATVDTTNLPDLPTGSDT